MTLADGPETVLVAEHVVLGDASMAPLRPGYVAYVGDRITDVGLVRDSTSFPSSATVHTFGAATIMPGLIDTHVHLTQRGDGSPYEYAALSTEDQRHRVATANARAHLLSGVTTVRDLGSHLDLLEWRSNLPSAGLPHLVLYGPPITRTGGHMHHFGGAANGPTGVRERAQRNIEAGADGLKIVASGGGTIGTAPGEATYAIDELTAAVEVAHASSRVATAHAVALESMKRALGAGVDGIEHLAFAGANGDVGFDEAVAHQIVERGIAMGSTLGVNFRYLELARLDSAPDFELEKQQQRSSRHRANAAALHRMGATILAASDSGWKFSRFGDFWIELEMLARAGMTPLEVIAAATARAADALGLHDRGRLRAGALADISVFSGDATADSAAFRKPLAVFVAGQQLMDRLGP